MVSLMRMPPNVGCSLLFFLLAFIYWSGKIGQLRMEESVAGAGYDSQE
jgi:hypothetical protein